MNIRKRFRYNYKNKHHSSIKRMSKFAQLDQIDLPILNCRTIDQSRSDLGDSSIQQGLGQTTLVKPSFVQGQQMQGQQQQMPQQQMPQQQIPQQQQGGQ